MRILYYFLQNPCPPRSGAHQRCLQVLRECKAAGHDLIFSSSTLHTKDSWSEESRKALREITGHEAQIYEGPNRVERQVDRIERKFRWSVLRKNGLRESIFCPHSLVRWFGKLVAKIRPDVIVINYVWFDQLMDHKRWRKIRRVIDIHDLVSKNLQMRLFVEKQLDDYTGGADASRFRDAFNAAKIGFRMDPEELEVYEKYDTVLSISSTEQDEMQQMQKNLKIVHAPFVQSPSVLPKTYQGPPILSLGPNPFNIQGYLYFQDAILPEILRRAPGFLLTVTGSIKPELCRNAAINFKGFVENRDSLLREAGYAVCPVFAGTGQQIKIVEAMAYGLAVVAFEEAARNSLIKHGENGLVADSPGEFARHVVSLQNDMELRRRLGQSAKQAIRQEWEMSQGLRAFVKNLGNDEANCRRVA